jgi:hypothetical protein
MGTPRQWSENANRATDSSLAEPARRAVDTGTETGYEHEHRDATPRAPSLSWLGKTVKSFSRLPERGHGTCTGALTVDTPFSSKDSIAK